MNLIKPLILKRLIFFLPFLLCFHSILLAQNSIKGSVVDTTNVTTLRNANIVLLHQKDSTLYKFTRTSDAGVFEFSNLDTGKYIVMMSYPKYVEYVDEITINAGGATTDLGKFFLTPVEHLLNEVVVKGRRPVTIKGDTTEYDAGSFVVNANDRVEDLLKQLPGIQVDKDGKITAQGKTIEKVLVDGEEFFGDDPTLVTKNVRADMVDKVQLFDKTSDQAAFTGIDDGNKSKTLNIKLKEDKKSGYFGKIAAGYGRPNQYYETNGAINYFKGKKKVAVFGTMSNDGITAFGFRDAQKYGASGGGNLSVSDDGGISISFGESSDIFDAGFNGEYGGKGIPVTFNGGAMFQDKWNADKNSINASVRTGILNVTGNEQNLNQNNLASGVLISEGNSIFDNKASQTSANAIFETKLDTLNSLKITLSGATRFGNSLSRAQNETVRDNGDLVNTSQVNNSNKGTNNNVSANILWNKKFKKARRTFSMNVVTEMAEEQTDGFLFSQNDFYDSIGNIASQSLIDQRKINVVKNQSLRTSLHYTEPLSATLSMVLSYIGNLSSGLKDNRSFNRDNTGDYSQLDNQFSNIFELKQFGNQGGLDFDYNKDKLNVKWGSKVGTVRFDQFNQLTNNSFGKTFLNISPSASLKYKKSQSSSYAISYNGNTDQPSIDQINPVQINNDPLNIRVGNPNLRTSFSNRFSFNLNSYKPLNNAYRYINLFMGNTINPIVNNVITDLETGRSVFMPSNINKQPFYWSLYTGSGNNFKKINLNYNYGTNILYGTSYNLVNSVLNTNTSIRLGVNIGVSKFKKDKYEIYINWSPNYSFMKASLQPQLNNNNFNYYLNGQFKYFLPANFIVSAELNSQYQGRSAAFTEPFRRTLIHPQISKTFFKEKNLMLSFKVHDLLNQNAGFNRNSSLNQIYQNQYTTIRRFYMFTVSWDFNKMGGK